MTAGIPPASWSPAGVSPGRSHLCTRRWSAAATRLQTRAPRCLSSGLSVWCQNDDWCACKLCNNDTKQRAFTLIYWWKCLPLNLWYRSIVLTPVGNLLPGWPSLESIIMGLDLCDQILNIVTLFAYGARGLLVVKIPPGCNAGKEMYDGHHCAPSTSSLVHF